MLFLIRKITENFPVGEKYSLASQLRRLVAFIPANTIEGKAIIYQKEYVEFLYFAKGFLKESKYHLLFSLDLDYIKKDEYPSIQYKIGSVRKQLKGLTNY